MLFPSFCCQLVFTGSRERDLKILPHPNLRDFLATARSGELKSFWNQAEGCEAAQALPSNQIEDNFWRKAKHCFQLEHNVVPMSVLTTHTFTLKMLKKRIFPTFNPASTQPIKSKWHIHPLYPLAFSTVWKSYPKKVALLVDNLPTPGQVLRCLQKHEPVSAV